MLSSAYVLVEIDNITKSFIVELKDFPLGSEKAIKALNDQEVLFYMAKRKNFKIICDEKVVFDPKEQIKKEQEIIKAEQECQEIDKRYRFLYNEEPGAYIEISKKDLKELTEKEIIFLAKARAIRKMPSNAKFIKTYNFNYYFRMNFELEYKDIIEKIEREKKMKQMEHRYKEIERENMMEQEERRYKEISGIDLKNHRNKMEQAERRYKEIVDSIDLKNYLNRR